jgi:hypothetical protein
MAEVEVKVPKGFKRCPKCKNLVKGPRTKICTHDGCGHVFEAKKPLKSKPARAGKATKPVKEVVQPTVVEEPQVPIIPDPYTQTSVVRLNLEDKLEVYKKGKLVKKIGFNSRCPAIGPKEYRQEKIDRIVQKASENPTEYGVFPSEVSYATS